MYENRLSPAKIIEEVDNVMNKIDMDKSGQIEYSEWVLGTIDLGKVLMDDKLKKAFETFDKDGSGEITCDEIKQVLGIGKKVGSEQIWKDIVGEVDHNGDGVVDFDEFKDMMKKILVAETSKNLPQNL